MDMRDDLLKNNLGKEQRKNTFYGKLVLATFRASGHPGRPNNIMPELVGEAERLGISITELDELEKTIKDAKEMRNKEILSHYIQVTKAQLNVKRILSEQKDKE